MGGERVTCVHVVHTLLLLAHSIRAGRPSRGPPVTYEGQQEDGSSSDSASSGSDSEASRSSGPAHDGPAHKRQRSSIDPSEVARTYNPLWNSNREFFSRRACAQASRVSERRASTSEGEALDSRHAAGRLHARIPPLALPRYRRSGGHGQGRRGLGAPQLARGHGRQPR